MPVALHEVSEPTPDHDELKLKVHAVGLNFADLLMIQGTYQERPPLPFTLGMELCGSIVEVGKNVSGFELHQRVAAHVGHGAMAEFCRVPADQCVPVPDSTPSEAAAGFLIAYGTSHVALAHRAKLRSGERLLVLGAGGGIGLTAVEIGKLMGATVIAAARGPRKLEVARSRGADHLLDTDSADLRTVVKSLGGADVVYDPVGGDLFEQALRASNPEARILPMGFASGSIPRIPANILLVKNLTVMGVYLGGYRVFRPEVLTSSTETLVGWLAEGRLRPTIDRCMPIGRANEALELLRKRQIVGKIVVTLDR